MPLPVDEHLKFCTERSRLTDLMNSAAIEYAKAVADQMTRIGNMSTAEYAQSQTEVSAARWDAEHARDALTEHRREHGC
jgi:hypothetical protein